MEFNTLVKTKLFPILQKYGFEIVEELKNIIRFQSSVIKISIVHNSFENSNTIWIGKKGATNAIEINNNTIALFFNSNLRLSDLPVQSFINNLAIFFENEGELLLMGNENVMNGLERFDLHRSKKYTQDLIERQNLDIADKAWIENDYKKFITIINQLNYETIPKPYLLKYKIAKQRIN